MNSSIKGLLESAHECLNYGVAEASPTVSDIRDAISSLSDNDFSKYSVIFYYLRVHIQFYNYIISMIVR